MLPLVAVAGIIFGLVISKILSARKSNRLKEESASKAKLLLEEAKVNAESTKKEKMLQAKEHFLKLKSEFDTEANRKKNQLISNERKLKQREHNQSKIQEQLKRKEAELDQLKENLQAQLLTVDKKKADVEQLRAQQVNQLEKVAHITADEAKSQLIETLKEEAQTEASSHIKDILDEAKLSAAKQAKKVVIETIQRTASEHAIENCVSVFNIESDDIKGKIIGREGRNIRTLESATGVEIIVDDTPEAIIISGFDPVRREVARLSLHRLVTDGRIHPARIEEVVNKTSKNIEEEIVELGERAVIDLGVHGLHPELIKLVGRMRFRSSYGQNLLHHSKEVARLAATMASELGLNSKLAKRAGLLHDIGKVWPEEPDLPHAILGMDLAKKYKENP